MTYTTIIGLEVHVQLLTKSKLFCGCANLFNPENPNVQTCPVCLGLPGALPVMNREAFRLALKAAMALNCNIPGFTKWDRKQYYYPDLPKAYQISQYDLPFSEDGRLEFEIDPESDDVFLLSSGDRRKMPLYRWLAEDEGWEDFQAIVTANPSVVEAVSDSISEVEQDTSTLSDPSDI